MTCYHPDNEGVIQAAQWAAEQVQTPRYDVIMARFGLTNLEAVEAAAMAERFRMIRRAFS